MAWSPKKRRRAWFAAAILVAGGLGAWAVIWALGSNTMFFRSPTEVQAKIVEDMKKALATDELKTIWAANGSDIPNVTMAAYGGFVNTEVKR